MPGTFDDLFGELEDIRLEMNKLWNDPEHVDEYERLRGRRIEIRDKIKGSWSEAPAGTPAY